jgi:hypothetical protein
MTLPYTTEVWFAALAEYHATWYPGPVLMTLAAVSAFVAALRGGPAGGRAAFLFLAAMWIWVGAVHQILHMTNLNFMAPLYGGAWIAGGVLFAAYAGFGRDTRLIFTGDARGQAALALVVLGLIVYPLAGLALGYGWRSVPLAGAAPDPTAILTAGTILALRRPPLWLFVPPLLWAVVAGVSAYLLDFPLAYASPAAAVGALGLAARARMRG